MKMKHSQPTTARTIAAVGALVSLLGLAGTASAQQPAAAPAAGTASAQQAAAAPVINPGAIEALKTMGAYLRTLKSFTVHADATIDEALESGQKIQFANTIDLRARMPDRMRIDVKSDRKQRELYYNGKTVTQYAPRMKYYATVAAPATARETLTAAATKFDLNVPLADLFFWGTDQAGIADIKSAIYIGPSHVGGIECDHYAYRQEGTDWQLWIRSGKTPLPCKLVITTMDIPSQPQYAATLRWDLKAPVDEKAFTFVPPKGAQKIEMVPTAAAK